MVAHNIEGTMFHKDPPLLARRGVHLDLKGLPPTFERLLKLLHHFAAARFNFVLVEWEDAFPWTIDARYRSVTAYTPAQVDAFQCRARELQIEIIPLVQSLGHMETPLRLPENKPLREVQDRCDGLNPLAGGARALVERMVEDVLARSGTLKHFHLGGDEAWTFGQHADTRASIEKQGKAALYLHHIEPVLDRLIERGIRPILWHDMMHDWPEPELRRLGEKCDLMFWWYRGSIDQAPGKFNVKVMERFVSAGVPLWGACAYKGADSRGDAELPDVRRRVDNALGWAQTSRRYPLRGVVATGWSRYSTARVQCEPIVGALDSLLKTAGILHDGHAPGDEACEAMLKQLGEWEQFRACRDALAEMSKALKDAREYCALIRQQAWLEQYDAHRSGSGVRSELLKQLRGHMQDARSAAERFRLAADGMIPEIWIDEFINERLEPLRAEALELM